MPLLEAPLYDYLTAELQALIDDRVLPLRGSEGEGLPYVTFQRISAVRTYTHDPFPEPAWVEARYQFNCWASTMVEAIDVGEALVFSLSGYSGAMGDVTIGRADVVFELDDYQETTKLYRRIVDVIFAYEEGGLGS